MCTKSDIPQGENYYIGVKLIKARVAYRINGNEIVYDLNRARNPNLKRPTMPVCGHEPHWNIRILPTTMRSRITITKDRSDLLCVSVVKNPG